VIDSKRSYATPALPAPVARNDLLMHNMRPQAMARLGFDYARLRLVDPLSR
jgi:crotonobetainyl-CoA:carnitine CoA-transferase CaiB-like acyl-CoA transferase